MARLTPTRQADRSWLFTWTAVAGVTYRLVLHGTQVGTSTSGSYVWRGGEYQTTPPPLEVVPEGEKALSETHPPRLLVQWYRVAEADYYTVEQYLNAAWTEVARVDESGDQVYNHLTPAALDGEVVQVRVKAYDSVGAVSSPRAFTKTIVTPPRPPSVGVTYAAGTISVVTV